MPDHKGADEVDLSIVVPMYNEADCLDDFFVRMRKVLGGITGNHEIICVNDGSTDDTLKRLMDLRRRDPRIVVIDLARNFGKDMALTAGLDFARGRAVVPIDADLQDPPELIKDFVEKWKEGYEVVYGIRRVRKGDSVIKRVTANVFYRLLSYMASVEIPQNTGDLRLMDRRVVDAVKTMSERVRFMKGVFAWVGFRSIGIPYDRQTRTAGKTKWRYGSLWRFAVDGVTSFSSFPVKIWGYIGIATASFSFLYMLFLLFRTLWLGVDLPGYTSLMVVVLFLGGVQLIGIGVLGEYTARIFDEVKRRPLYIVRNVFDGREGAEDQPRTIDSAAPMR